MLRSRSVRRTVAVTASVGVAAALTWLPAAPASAAVAAQYGAQGTASTSSSCTLSTGAGSDSPSSPLSTFHHGTRKHSVNLDAGFTNTGDSSDTVEMIGHYSSSMTLGRKHGDLTKVLLSGNGKVSIQSSKGNATACEPQAAVDAVALGGFTEGRPGWLLVDRQTVPKQGIALALVENTSTDNTVVFDLWQGRASHTTGRGFVKPGSYSFEIAVGLTAGNFPPILLKRAPKSTIAMVFHKAGSALSSSGSGKKYVEFPSSVSCGSHKATLRWKSSAGQVDSGSFLVNGKQKKSDGTPKPGEKIVLKHLSSTADLKITAKLKLKGGGSATASRTYLPCKG
jgi:hypothetical protein